MDNRNKEVTKFLDGLNHPKRTEMETLRRLILESVDGLTETIKWNGPNYIYNGQDRITMKIQPPKNIQLIFHRGAKKLTQPTGRLIEDQSGLLKWKENDRAIVTFDNETEIQKASTQLKDVITNWIKASSVA